MSITLVHHLKTKVGAVENISPSVNHIALSVNNGVVEVEPIEVECHRAHTHGSQPDTDHRPGTQEEVQSTAVAEARILENQATEVTVSSHDVVGLFLLTELVAIVGRLSFGGLTDQSGNSPENRASQRTGHHQIHPPHQTYGRGA